MMTTILAFVGLTWILGLLLGGSLVCRWVRLKDIQRLTRDWP